MTRGALIRFRVMAWVTGVMLLLLVFVAMPLKYLGDDESLTAVVGPAHGFLYIVYVVTVFQLAYQLRWKPVKVVLVMLAGTVPFMSFVAEHRVVHEVRAATAQQVTA